MRRQWWRLIGVAGVAVAIVAGLFALGGSLSYWYVTTHGVSMEPRFHQGDLVVIRPAGTYQVGDVVAYRSQLLDSVVMHRIVARDGDRYLFKGDNNPWIDRDQPTRSDLIGRQWLRVPRGGVVVGWLRERGPLLVAVSLLVAGLGTTRRHRRRKLGTPVGNARVSSPPRKACRIPQRLLPVAAVGLAAFLALGALAYSRPVAQPTASKVAYTQRGTFAYSALAPAGPVYNDGVTTGEPLFLRLVNTADLRFTYKLDSSSPRAVSGSISLTAEISDPTGWHRRVQLAAPVPFRGDGAEAHATLDLARVQALIAEVEALTGVHNGTHTVTITAHVEVNGTVAGQPLADTFTPDLAFQLDALQLRPAWTPGDTSTTEDPLAPSQPGSLTEPGTAARQLAAFGRHLEVAHARTLALAGALASAVAVAVALIAGRRRRRDEVARIDARHGYRIVPVAAGGGDATGAVVDVTTMTDLARLAEQYGCLILHHDHDGAHSYLFQVDRTIYRYRIRSLTAAAS